MIRARLRQQVEDFRVTEQIDLPFDGNGEHLWVRVRKRGMTTPQLVNQLAAWAGVRANTVGYSGLKDKFAETEQWFSIALSGRDDPSPPNADQWDLLEQHRHGRKLRRGLHASNRFEIRLRELSGDPGAAEARLLQLREKGCPNYFGEQRFGRHGDNVDQAMELFTGQRRVKNRSLKGLLISAARSHLFNQLLDQRLRLGNWNQALPGEVMLLAGSRSFFVAETLDSTTVQRLGSGDVTISGPLWGKGATPAAAQVAILEQQQADRFPELAKGLADAGLSHERRSLCIDLRSLEWRFQGEDLVLEFELPPGCFATAVLRELVDWRES